LVIRPSSAPTGAGLKRKFQTFALRNNPNVNAMISLRGVSKVFPGAATPAVSNLTIDFLKGETVVLVGPSGCGKTTILRMINRLIEATSGTIFVDGKDTSKVDPVELRRGIGYVIQSVGLMPHRTVAENIVTVPHLLGWDKTRMRERVEGLASMFRLEADLLDRYPAELSGGQRQRVGVARALAADPPVMLMDEPFAAVDPIVRSRLQDQFLEIQRTLGKTIVIVTHDINEAIKMADRVAILNTGGVVEQFAKPEELLRHPANEFVSEFLGVERGLKRLALIPVKDIEVERGPVVSLQSTVQEAIEVMNSFDLQWTSVVEDGRLLGWVDERMLNGLEKVGDATPRPFSAHLMADDSLLQALDSIVTSRTYVAAVVRDDEQYEGILRLERISREIIRDSRY
jgi:osmoprotectant transport system ATP-binding protein